MSGFVGADIEQLRSMATTLDGEADRLVDAYEAVTGQVAEVPWFGPSAEAFSNEWHEQHRPAAERAAAVLNDMADKLRANADAQEQTSADLGGASGAERPAVAPAVAVAPAAVAVEPAVAVDPAVAVPGATVWPAVATVEPAVAAAAFAPDAVDQADAGRDNDEAAAAVAADQADAGRGGDEDSAGQQEPAPPMGPFAPGYAPGETGGPGYVIGPPTKPDLTWDDDYEYDSADPEFGDYVDWNSWGLKETAAHAHPGLQDAADFYSHYRSNTGLPKEFDYEEAYSDDESIRQLVDNEIARTQQGVDDLIASGAGEEFSVTGDAHSTRDENLYPATENWQKTIGGYQQWSSADVRVDGDQATMTVTVHAEDYYNFNAGEADIASGAPDQENGRFTELGWAKPFESHGELTREVTWTVGDPDSVQVAEPEGGR